MDAKVAQALKTDRVIDITTTGRTSGEQRRIEIWFHNVDDELYITGRPGSRDWYANLVANPNMTFHLKNSVQADISATAITITDAAEKRAVLEKILARLDPAYKLDEWVEKSPLVYVQLQLD